MSRRGPDTTPTDTGPRHPEKTPQQQADQRSKSLRDEAAKLRRQADIEHRRGNQQDYADLTAQATKLEAQAKSVTPDQFSAPTPKPASKSKNSQRPSGSSTLGSSPSPTAANSPAPSTQWGAGANGTQSAVAGSLFGVDENVTNISLPDGPTPKGLAAVGSGGRPMTTVLRQVSSFYHLSSDDRDVWASRLASAGYLEIPAPDSKGRVKKLSPTAVQNAFKSAVLDAARSGMSVGELLDQRAQEQGGDGTADGSGSGGGSGASQQTRQATNPLDVKALGNSAAQKGLGRDLTSAETAKLQGSFASTESPYLQAGATTSEPGSGGWADWAQQQVREFDPHRFDARQVLSGVNILAEMLKGGGNVQPIVGSSNG